MDPPEPPFFKGGKGRLHLVCGRMKPPESYLLEGALVPTVPEGLESAHFADGFSTAVFLGKRSEVE
jgi:hypothetical protein